MVENSLTREQISQEMNEIVAKAEKRKQESINGCLLNAADCPGDALYYMTETERTRMHELSLMLPSFKQLAEEAKERIQKRIQARQAKRQAA